MAVVDIIVVVSRPCVFNNACESLCRSSLVVQSMNLYTIKIKRIVLAPVIDDIASIGLSARDVEGEVFRSTIDVGAIGEAADFRVGDVGCERQRVVAEIDATRVFTRRISSGRICHIGLNDRTVHVQCKALINVEDVDTALGNSDDTSFVDGQLA